MLDRKNILTVFIHSLPLITVAVATAAILNTYRITDYQDPFLSVAVHVLFQAVLICGLMAILRNRQILRVLFAIFLAFAVFLQLAYGATLSVSIVMSVVNSSFSEASSFIQFNLLPLIVADLIFIALLIFQLPEAAKVARLPLLLVGLSYLLIPTVTSPDMSPSSQVYRDHLESALARGHSRLGASIEFFVNHISHRFPPLKNIRGVTDTISLFSQQTELPSTWTEVSAKGEARLLVLGIGESLRADNLGVYGYQRDTTPHLSALSDQLTIYQQAYSAGTNTWSSIPAALTKASAEHDFSKSIINLAKDAGYKVYWFSNQARYSEWDFAVSSLAKQADKVHFFSETDAGSTLDFNLVTKLQTTLESAGNDSKALIILHYYGSHMEFEDRYPPEFASFQEGDPLLAQYDNSVLYTDYIQSEVIKLVSEHGGQYLFFADHGLGEPESAIPLMHDVRDNPSLRSLEVPFFTYPAADLGIEKDKPVSLFYFECVFSRWSGIQAAELNAEYCDSVLNREEISFVDANLIKRDVHYSDLMP